jgi:hypothetical protein
MNISSKNTMRTIAVGVVALAISSLGSWAFAAPKVCNENYLQSSNVSGKTLAAALDACYVKRPAGPSVDNCVQKAFKAHYRDLQTKIDTFKKCSANPSR